MCGYTRNLTDDQLRALAQTGGTVGLNLYPPFLGGRADFDTLRAHLEHMLTLCGEDHVALGGDLDGCDELARGFYGRLLVGFVFMRIYRLRAIPRTCSTGSFSGTFCNCCNERSVRDGPLRDWRPASFLGSDKPMDVFGGAWVGYVDKLREGLSVIGPEDTTVLLGDLSWALDLNGAREDFAMIAAIPGRKIIVKGNHDYWWTTAAKFYRFCEENGFPDLYLLNNNCYFYNGIALTGTRGWFFEEDAPDGSHNDKIFKRELLRLEASLRAAEIRPKSCAFCTIRRATAATNARKFWRSSSATA